MGKEENNKFLSMVLKALGVILIVGLIIYVIGCGTGIWSAPHIQGLLTYLFAILCSGISLFLLGVVYSRKGNLNKTSLNILKGLEGLFIIGIILLIVTMLSSLNLYDPIRVIFGTILGLAIYLVFSLRNPSSER